MEYGEENYGTIDLFNWPSWFELLSGLISCHQGLDNVIKYLLPLAGFLESKHSKGLCCNPWAMTAKHGYLLRIRFLVHIQQICMYNKMFGCVDGFELYSLNISLVLCKLSMEVIEKRQNNCPFRVNCSMRWNFIWCSGFACRWPLQSLESGS